jgi:hypothetical protein
MPSSAKISMPAVRPAPSAVLAGSSWQVFIRTQNVSSLTLLDRATLGSAFSPSMVLSTVG